MILTAQTTNKALSDVLTTYGSDYQGFGLIFSGGTVPSTVTAPELYSSLAGLSLPNNWGTFDDVSLIELDGEATGTVTKAGTPTWWSFAKIDGTEVVTPLLQGSVSESGQGGDIQFNNIDWAAGDQITLESFSIQLPVATSSNGGPPL